MNRLHILFLDDDDDDLYLFEKVIEGIPDIEYKGFTIFKQFKEKLEEIIQGGGRCLLFVDLNMPHISGEKILAYLRTHENYYLAPTIVFTTSTSPFDIQEAYRLGASAYIVKPQSLRDLKIKITKTIDFYQNVVTVPGGIP